jgi:hypothetical protein
MIFASEMARRNSRTNQARQRDTSPDTSTNRSAPHQAHPSRQIRMLAILDRTCRDSTASGSSTSAD